MLEPGPLYVVIFHSVHLALVLHLRLWGQEKTNSTMDSVCLFVC